MNGHGLLRVVRRTMELAAMIGVVFLVAVFTLTAGMLQPPGYAYTQPGLVSEYGIRPVLLILFLAAVGVCGLLFLCSRFPRLYRYPVTITAQNIDVQYAVAKVALASGQVICEAYFCMLMIGVFRAAVPLGSPGFFVLTGAAAAAALAVAAGYLDVAKKNR